MAVDLDKYQRLKQAAEQAQREADKAEGALDAAMATLKAEFGVTTIEAADKLQKRLNAEAAKAEAAFEDALADFEREWGAKLREAAS